MMLIAAPIVSQGMYMNLNLFSMSLVDGYTWRMCGEVSNWTGYIQYIDNYKN